jgi:zinc and cadmium transporter
VTITTIILILFASGLLGAIVAFFSAKVPQSVLESLFSLSGAYILAIVCVHLLPELFEIAGVFEAGHHHHDGHAHAHGHLHDTGRSAKQIVMILLVMIGVGMVFQLVLDRFSDGMDHGHHHGSLKLNPYVVFGSIFIHSFTESTVFSAGKVMGDDFEVGNFLAGMVVHKVPVAFVLSLAMLKSFPSQKMKAVMLISAFVISAPLGVVMSGWMMDEEMFSKFGFVCLLAFVCGNFLHIAWGFLVEGSLKQRFSPKKLVYIVLGFGLGLLVLVAPH